jgi:hypothetical protein
MEPGVSEVAAVLGAMGCPQDRVEAMAAQLIKRAHQLAEERAWTRGDALAYLLRLMAGGWAANAQGIGPGAFGSPGPATLHQGLCGTSRGPADP